MFAFGGPIGKKPLNPTVTKVLKWSPGILVFVSLALTLGFHNLDFANYEPFSLIFGQVGVGIQWALLPLVFVGALFSRRIYCNFACPVGYVLTKIVMLCAKVAKAVKGGKKASGKAVAAGAANKDEKTAPKGAKGRKPMKVHDVLVFVVGLAIAVVSLLAIINATGVFGG